MTQESSTPIRVMLVDDQRLIREGIGSLLSIQPGLEIVGKAVNGQDAIRLATELQPDVILMDIRMPEMDGIEATRQVRQVATCQILMLTTFDDEEYIVKALQAGAVGYLLKDLPAADLAQAIRLANAGIFQLDPSVAGKLVGVLGKVGSGQVDDVKEVKTFGLSARELEVLRLLADGATNREIGNSLFISLGTVKNHVSNILGRLGLRDRVQAAIFARENNLV